jgi:hypothetical protein
MRPSLLCAAALALTISGPAAQVVVPPRDARPATEQPAAGTASISGSVTVARTGEPARRVRMSVSGGGSIPGGEMRLSRNATTDEHGRFFIPSLPAGRYTLSASKPGHVTISYGQRQAGSGRPGTPIQLGDGERFEAHLQIPRGGVLTGTVLDELGEATPGTSVRALRYAIQNGQRTLQPGGTGSTDDRGIFRIYGLQPGEYVVCAMPRPNVSPGPSPQMQAEMAAARRALSGMPPVQARTMEERLHNMEAQLAALPADPDQRTAYAQVCYPGTTLPTSAVSIPLGAGQERAGIDFQLQLVSVATVEGVVISPAAGAAQGVQISLVPAGPSVPGIGSSSARAGVDGRFSVNNVAPGQYRLTARGTVPVPGGAPVGRGRGGPNDQAPRLWGAADISVDGRDVTDVALVMNPAFSLSGQLAFDGGAPPADLTRIRVTLSPAPGPDGPVPGASSSMATADASGRFTVTNVVPGYYRISVAGVQGWWPESAIVGSQDALDFPVEVRPGASLNQVLVTMVDQQTEVTGVLSDSRGEPVPDYTLIIFPADSAYWTPNARRVQSTRPATDGRFSFRNLPAGDYRIATVLDPEPGSWTDPAYLRELETVSLQVPIRRGEKKTQNIRISQ